MNEKNIVELLADTEHEQWSHWMKYLFTKGQELPDGGFVINHDSVSRWKKQMNTPYKELSEKEKESDRVEARKSLSVVSKALFRLRL